MTHPAVLEYWDEKRSHDEAHFIEYVVRRCESNPQLNRLCQTPEYAAFVGLAKYERPFDRILSVLSDLSEQDLEWLVDHMPNGWARSRVIDEERARLVPL